MKCLFKTMFILIILLKPSISNAQVYEILIGNDLKKDAKEIVNQMISGMNELLDKAIEGADFITESRLKEISLMLNGVKNFISNERIKLLEDLDIQRLNIVKGIDQILANKFPSVYEINDLSAILTANTQDIVNSFGGLVKTKDKFGIYKINGISLEYKKTGLYRISFIGNVFGKKNIANTILINGDEKVLHQGANINNMYVEFPSSELEPFFNLVKVSRIPLKIISVQSTKKLFGKQLDTLISFENTILLHPKLPIQYELFEISKSYDWSEAIAGPLKEDYTVPNQDVVITAQVEGETRIDQQKTRFYDPSDEINRIKNINCDIYKGHTLSYKLLTNICNESKNKQLKDIGNWIDAPVYFSEEQSVRRTYHASSRKRIWIEVYYNKQIPSNPIEVSKKFKSENNGFLSYGVYESEYFSNDYASFRLKIKYFFDDWRIINPTFATTIKGVKTEMETGAIKRLTINISSLSDF